MHASLYDEAIKAAARAKTGVDELDAPDRRLVLDNPMCGDRVRLDLRLGPAGEVVELGHRTRGCLLTRAAANLAAGLMLGKDASGLRALREGLAAYLAGERDAPPAPELEVFAPVRAVKSRRDCVLLPFCDIDDPANQS